MKAALKGKVCMITGATSGIGLASAKALAQRGATTVIIGRNRDKTRRICARIKNATGNPAIEYMIADLSSQQEIRKLADEFNSRYERLDVLVNNAGARFLSRDVTVDGYEMTFALNHLAPFLLTRMLLDRLKAAGNARIINVASEAHRGALINFDDIQNEKNYFGKQAYAQSKLANILFTHELANRLKDCGITANAMEPGNVFTHFSSNNGWYSWAKHMTSALLARNLVSPQKASRTIIHLAASPDVANITGAYFTECRAARSSPESYNAESARLLWEISETLTSH